MAENLEEKMEKERGLSPRRREGVREGRWAVLDLSLIHI